MIANAVMVEAQMRILWQGATIGDFSGSESMLEVRPKLRRGGR
jgi:hypothetical protein